MSCLRDASEVELLKPTLRLFDIPASALFWRRSVRRRGFDEGLVTDEDELRVGRVRVSITRLVSADADRAENTAHVLTQDHHTLDHTSSSRTLRIT